MTHDGPPTRPPHLRPVTDEPPYDPEYDHPGRVSSHDPLAERALLNAVIVDPDAAGQLAGDITSTDFHLTAHETIWNTWHQLLEHDGAHPDPVVLNAALVKAKQPDAVRALVDVLATPSTPALVDQYVRIVRDHTRIRAAVKAYSDLGRALTNPDPDQLDALLCDAADALERAATYAGGTRTNTTGLADLTWVLSGVAPTNPPPVYARRLDGTALFYKGRVNGVFGDPESGKTWLGLVAGVEAMHEGGLFAMVDVDHNGQDHTVARLMLLGARIEHLADPDRFRYYEPDDADELRAAVRDVTTLAPDVFLLDSIGEVLPMLGVKSVDNDEITAALREIVMPPAKVGSCVIHVDHLPKSADARSTGYAIGGTAKKRATDGAYIRVEARTQPVPGGIGRMTLRIEKDRTGELRKSSGGGYAGDFVLDSTLSHVTTWSIGRMEAPKNADGTFRPTTNMEKVAAYVAEHPQCTGRDIEAAIPGTAKYIRDALTILITEGHIVRTKGLNRSWQHTLAIPYREAEDDLAQPQL
ncbi:MAG TPA: DnaB-like helicase N-terminal domain-containing protein [Nocardioides sp.]|uniref:DnaB-like helicase N-terminal domain-containing protein n=1 Tax=Nocardioides sp. TaxID=35761 RepID=UPI002ED9B26B